MIEVKLQFATEAELVAFFTRAKVTLTLTAGSPAVTPEPASVVAKPKAEAKKADPSPAPATSQSPAPATTAPVEPDAPAATAAPTGAPESAAPAVSYEASGIPGAVPAYLGAKGSDGYMARRQNVVDLLAKYGVAKGPDLKPAQFALFLAELNDLPKA